MSAAPAKVQNPGTLDDGNYRMGLAAGFSNRLLATLICGIWVTAAASLLVDAGAESSFHTYAVIVGAGGIILALLAVLLLKYGKGSMDKELVAVKDEKITMQKLWAVLLVVWWGVGAGLGTFRSPFTATTNGYFALWAGFLFSLMALADVMESVGSKVTGAKVGSPARGLFFAAVVLIIALIPFVDNSNVPWYGESVFGMISAAVTIVVCLVLILADKLEHKIAQVIAAGLRLLWLATAGILTFRCATACPPPCRKDGAVGMGLVGSARAGSGDGLLAAGGWWLTGGWKEGCGQLFATAYHAQ
jgi:hypothetical protein